MKRILEQFHTNLQYARQLGGLYSFLAGKVTDAVDISNLLRAELVLAVSAVDHFIHEIVRTGMLESYQGERSMTEACKHFQISFDVIRQLRASEPEKAILDNELRKHLGWRIFQSFESVTDALALVTSPREVWKHVSWRLGVSREELKTEWNLIVKRRNKIAHEADMDPASPGARWPIIEEDIEKAIIFLEHAVEAIYEALNVNSECGSTVN